jgi:Protein of unknown function (DUF3592)
MSWSRRATRPPVRRRVWLAVIATNVVLAIVALGLLYEGIDLRTHAVRTVATIEHVEVVHDARSTHLVFTLSFTDRHGKLVTAQTSALGGSNAAKLESNDRIAIYYAADDPNNLQDARYGPPGSSSLRMAVVLAGLILLIPVAALGFFSVTGRVMARRFPGPS